MSVENDELLVMEVAADPDPTRLLERILDKLDDILVRQGFQFREEKVMEDAAEGLQQWIFEFYDDLAGGDSDYDPKKPLCSDSEEVAVEGIVSDDEDEAELCDTIFSSESPAAKKQKSEEEEE